MQIKSAYTTPWYDDVLPLPVHPLRCHRNLIDRDWDTSSQESAESINAPPSPTQTLRRRRHKRNRPIVPTTPHPAPLGPNQYDHKSYPSQPTVPLRRTRETSRNRSTKRWLSRTLTFSMKWKHIVNLVVRVHPYCCRCQWKRTMLKGIPTHTSYTLDEQNRTVRIQWHRTPCGPTRTCLQYPVTTTNVWMRIL
jgi:hypothetical protein